MEQEVESAATTSLIERLRETLWCVAFAVSPYLCLLVTIACLWRMVAMLEPSTWMVTVGFLTLLVLSFLFAIPAIVGILFHVVELQRRTNPRLSISLESAATGEEIQVNWKLNGGWFPRSANAVSVWLQCSHVSPQDAARYKMQRSLDGQPLVQTSVQESFSLRRQGMIALRVPTDPGEDRGQTDVCWKMCVSVRVPFRDELDAWLAGDSFNQPDRWTSPEVPS